MRVLQKLRNCCHCLSWSSPVLCLRICPHTTPQNRLELCAVTITRPWKLISPFRLEDSSLQDWHWALDDIDDDCSSIHFWSPHLVTLCAMCAVQCLPFKKTLKMSDLSPRRSNGFKIKREDSSSTWYKWQLLPSPPPPCSSFDQVFPCKHLNFSVCVCLFVLGVTEVVQVVNILCIMDLEPRSLGGFALLRVGITWALGVLNWTKINWHINSGEEVHRFVWSCPFSHNKR